MEFKLPSFIKPEQRSNKAERVSVPTERFNFLAGIKKLEDYLISNDMVIGDYDEKARQKFNRLREYYLANQDKIGTDQDLFNLNEQQPSPVSNLAVFIIRDELMRPDHDE